MSDRKDILRVLDANFNRAREGLRVAEEVTRFALGSRALSERLKLQRHKLGKVLKDFPAMASSLTIHRDTHSDVGRGSSVLERRRRGITDLFAANIQRSKESLRVLEEFVKVIEPRAADRIKKIRFEVYDIEKRAVQKLDAVRHHLS